MKPRLLDLFCGAGGAAMGYHRVGFEVVGVDHVAQPNYPFEFVQADAIEYLEERLYGWSFMERSMPGFDAIHASPPCQAHSTLKARTRHIDHPRLIEPVRERLELAGLPSVIENVPGAPIRHPIMLCGSGFGLDVRRHRLFETNFPLMSPGCAHGAQADRFDVFEHGKWRKSPTVPVYGSGGRKAVEHWAGAMDIDWMTREELAEAIPPAYTEHIGGYLLSHLKAQEKAAA